MPRTSCKKISDDPLTQCPSCGQDTFSKQLTAAGFQLKGSGWYATDFKGGGAAATSAPATAAAPSDGATSTATASDAGGAAAGGCGASCACH